MCEFIIEIGSFTFLLFGMVQWICDFEWYDAQIVELLYKTCVCYIHRHHTKHTLTHTHTRVSYFRFTCPCACVRAYKRLYVLAWMMCIGDVHSTKR